METNINEIDIMALEEVLKGKLKPKRYIHTLGVAYTAASLAMCYKADIRKAQIAGLLHDCAKHFDNEKMLAYCAKHQITVSDAESAAPYLLHGKVGASLAQRKYQINDEEILSAITYHTTGKADMSLIEKIIYVSDYIEPHRNHAPNLDDLRHLAFIDLDKAVFEITEQTLNYLKKEQTPIDPATEITYDYYQRYAGK